MNIQNTSRLAYSEISQDLGSRQAEVLEVIRSAKSITNTEISQKLGYSINRITPRTNELVKAGLVCEDEKRPCKITGRLAIAWKVAKTTLF